MTVLMKMGLRMLIIDIRTLMAVSLVHGHGHGHGHGPGHNVDMRTFLAARFVHSPPHPHPVYFPVHTLVHSSHEDRRS